MTSRAGAFACAVLLALLAACNGGHSNPPTPPGPSLRPPSSQGPSPQRSSPTSAPTSGIPAPTQPTKWLCRPGLKPNPCEGGLDATIIGTNGSRTTQPFTPAANPKIDCFYVYPTVSRAPGANAPLASSPDIVAAARAQVARFAQVCRLYVPLYRQATVNSITAGHVADSQLAYNDVLSAWHDYLLHDNAGRGVVLIGHSQGAIVLRRLIQTDVEPRPAVRALLVSAIIPGANVAIPADADVGADFRQIPACRRTDQTGCVLAWSTFASAPPTPALFGRVGGGRRVLCTNPAALGGGSVALHPYLPTHQPTGGGLSNAVPPGTFSTDFVAFTGAVTGECVHENGADVLVVHGEISGHDVSQFDRLGPTWGLHVLDISIVLGDLVTLVGEQAAAYAQR